MFLYFQLTEWYLINSSGTWKDFQSQANRQSSTLGFKECWTFKNCKLYLIWWHFFDAFYLNLYWMDFKNKKLIDLIHISSVKSFFYQSSYLHLGLVSLSLQANTMNQFYQILDGFCEKFYALKDFNSVLVCILLTGKIWYWYWKSSWHECRGVQVYL